MLELVTQVRWTLVLNVFHLEEGATFLAEGTPLVTPAVYIVIVIVVIIIIIIYSVFSTV